MYKDKNNEIRELNWIMMQRWKCTAGVVQVQSCSILHGHRFKKIHLKQLRSQGVTVKLLKNFDKQRTG